LTAPYPPARFTTKACAFSISITRSQWSPCTSITEFFAELGQRNAVQRHAFDQRHRLAAAPFGFARYTHHAVARWRRCALLAKALGCRLPAHRAHTSRIGGINQPAAGCPTLHAVLRRLAALVLVWPRWGKYKKVPTSTNTTDTTLAFMKSPNQIATQ
jgi:hypothetical protein